MIEKLIEQQETIKIMQENEDNYLKIMKMYEECRKRINKAIEYCDFGIENWITDDGFVEEVLGDVKEILKGEDKDE